MICVDVKTNGSIVLDTVNTPPTCKYELLTPAENTSVEALYAHYFGFDADLFSIIIVACLTTFATGFSTGAMWKAWGKVQ